MKKNKKKKSFGKLIMAIVAATFAVLIAIEINAINNAKYKYINAIEKSGYSTVQNDKGENIYAELLIEIIQEQNLQLLDFECEMNFFNQKYKYNS